jgi:hypothetical protein
MSALSVTKECLHWAGGLRFYGLERDSHYLSGLPQDVLM